MENYILGDKINSGFEGTIYRATDIKNFREVAIKIAYYKPKVDIGIYKREIYALETLSKDPDCSKYVSCIYDHFEIPGGFAIVMELINGETIYELTKRLDNDARNGNYNLELRWIIIGRILEAINYVHSKGIHHRDITHNNVMWTGQYIVFIDFGFSCNSLTDDCSKTRMRFHGGEPAELYHIGQLILHIGSLNGGDLSIWDNDHLERIKKISSAWRISSFKGKMVYEATVPKLLLSDFIEIYNGDL